MITCVHFRCELENIPCHHDHHDVAGKTTVINKKLYSLSEVFLVSLNIKSKSLCIRNCSIIGVPFGK